MKKQIAPRPHRLFPANLERQAERARAYAKASRAANTRRAYATSFAQWREWAEVNGACPLPAQPEAVAVWLSTLADDGRCLAYSFDSHAERTGIAGLMRRLGELGIGYKDLSTHQSSLEDIFVSLVHDGAAK